MTNPPKNWSFPGALLDQLAREFVSPRGLVGVPRALAVRAGLDVVPDGLEGLAAAVSARGLRVVATLPASPGEALAAVSAHGLHVKIGPFELSALLGAE